MSSTGGINLPQIAKDSILRRVVDHYFSPEAVNTQKIVANVDPSGLTTGTALTLTANGAKFLRRARRPTLVLTDASGGGGGLTVTVRIVGFRWGQTVTESLVCACTDGSATTAVAANVYDEISSITPIAGLSTAASGDNLAIGIDGASFGLEYPIDNVADVISIVNVATNTEASPTTVSTTTVAPGPGAGKSFVQGLTLATTDRWDIKYQRSVIQDTNGTDGANR